MAFDEDDEIYEDFLVEAGEILEQLSEQVVALEKRPEDINLLNAIFRGFHTVKGSAGFLKLDAMVECCHKTENLFDFLRTGKLEVTSDLMDVVLQALDTINAQYRQVAERAVPKPADATLLSKLDTLVEKKAAQTKKSGPEFSDEEFEAYLDAMDSAAMDARETDTEVPDDQDEITEEEFEALLDQLHGKGNAPGGTPDKKLKEATSASKSEHISEDEFEALLDQLHGEGKAPVGTGKQPIERRQSISNKGSASPSSNTSKVVNAAQSSDDEDFNALLDQLKTKPATPPPSDVAETNGMTSDNSISTTETTVRVDTKRLDDIMNMVGELVLVRNRLVRLGMDSTDEALSKAVSTLDVVTADLQSSVMLTRMQPIKKVFGRFPRVVRDLARSLNKEIHLDLVGEDTDLDKNLVEALADPLVHMVRNAVDHGIELPAVREAAGKPRVGRLTLSAQQEGDHILLSVIDDGAGIDPEVLKQRALEKSILDEEAASRLTKSEAFNLIFAPGFSTRTEISDISGRGVGMDVVKTKITHLNGRIEIDSTPGEGTRLSIQVPLTLAIMPTLMVMLEKQSFALPLVNVNEIFQMDLTHTNTVDGQECVMIRDKAIPIFHLKQWLVRNPSPMSNLEEAHVVIVTVGARRIGFVVDKLIGQEEVVIKPLGKMLHGTPGMAGATITGDGTIALILDVPSLLKRYAGCVPA